MTMRRDWVETILARLQATYGARRVPAPTDETVAVWQAELDGLNSGAIGYAFTHLPPEHPPTPMEFRALTQNRPVETRKPVLATPVPADALQAHSAALKAIRGEIRAQPFDGLRWARLLRDREQSGERLTLFQREAWRKALRFPRTDPQNEAASGLQPDPPQTL